MTNDQLWQAILGELEIIVSKANFTTWFKNTGIEEKSGRDIVVAVPNAFTKEWLEKKYHKLIVRSLQNFQPEVRGVSYVIKSNQSKPTESEPIKTEFSESKIRIHPQLLNSDLNPRYTFDSFVVGYSNEMAFAAAKAVSENFASSYNPLFIYSEVGLGKTHLIQAIGNCVLLQKRDLKIRYATSERFTTEFVDALRKKQILEFKNRYRDNDILLIDDIQFIAPKEQTQGEFFHTFNTLYQNNKQVVLTSDRPPRDIRALENRLRSRFEGGMLVDISLPDVETWLAILQEKLKNENLDIPSNIMEYIARNIKNNIRELEGALNKILAFTKMKEEIHSLKETSRILKTLINEPQKKNLNFQEIIKSVSEFYGISVKEIISKGRRQEIVKPRQIAMYLMRSECNASYPAIGQQVGGRDHTTAIHSYKQIEQLARNNPELFQEIENIKERLYA